MVLRSDHIAGGASVIFGILVIALSGDLPTGQLSMPGSGFMPKLVAVLTIFFGLMLILRARESEPLAETSWSDGKHALMVTVITAVAIAIYSYLGFIVTMAALMAALLLIVERRKPLYAAAYSLGCVVLVYLTFEYLLKTPLPGGVFGY